MLVDLNMYLKPRLYILDGVIAMEGNGPMNGDPRKMNVLIFSTDPIAMDAVTCRILAVNPEYCHTVALGMRAKHGTHIREEIELLGDPLAGFITSDFKVNRNPAEDIPLQEMARPYIVEEKCVRCGECVDMCPMEPKVVHWQNNDQSRPPVYDYDRCIRCFCCQEMCPNGAIYVEERR
jgi:NAD-dependent dihydropyrimidine dehydrogenase PreA subunit